MTQRIPRKKGASGLVAWGFSGAFFGFFGFFGAPSLDKNGIGSHDCMTWNGRICDSRKEGPLRGPLLSGVGEKIQKSGGFRWLYLESIVFGLRGALGT
jgi:hypothetical protein